MPYGRDISTQGTENQNTAIYQAFAHGFRITKVVLREESADDAAGVMEMWRYFHNPRANLPAAVSGGEPAANPGAIKDNGVVHRGRKPQAMLFDESCDLVHADKVTGDSPEPLGADRVASDG